MPAAARCVDRFFDRVKSGLNTGRNALDCAKGAGVVAGVQRCARFLQGLLRAVGDGALVLESVPGEG